RGLRPFAVILAPLPGWRRGAGDYAPSAATASMAPVAPAASLPRRYANGVEPPRLRAFSARPEPAPCGHAQERPSAPARALAAAPSLPAGQRRRRGRRFLPQPALPRPALSEP